jgi:DNA-binding CsgD family transcriptional regulator
VQNLLAKLEVHSQLEAVALAIKFGTDSDINS